MTVSNLYPFQRLGVVEAPAPSGGDDTAAIASLVAAGHTIQLQPGVYTVSGAIGITADNISDLVIQGASGEWNNNSGTVINYTGTGTAISIRGTGGSTDGCVVRNLTINAPNAAILIDLGTSSGTATNAGSSNCKVEEVALTTTSTTNILINLAQSISCHIEDCALNGGNVGIQGVTTTNGFSNTHTIQANYFKNQTTIAIKNPGQNWSIIGNTFEPLASGAAGAILHDGTQQSNRSIQGSEVLTLISNSFQDVTNAGDWCTLRGEGIFIAGNMFDSAAARHIVFPVAVTGVVIIGNTLAAATTRAVDNVTGGTSTLNFIMLGNRFVSNTADFSGTPGSGSSYSVPGTVGIDLFGFVNVASGAVDVTTIGQGLRVAEGTNAKQGLSAAMTAGAVTVANTSVTANSRIVLTRQDGGTNPGAVYVSARTAGTSFTITSTNAADTGQVAYQIFEPG